MNWFKNINQHMLRTPGGWITSALAPALAVGFVFWSFKITLALIATLTIVRFTPTLRRLTLAGWASCWAVTWYQFAIWLTQSLHKHPFFLDRAPYYAGAAICLYFGGWAMLAAIGSTVTEEETLNKPEPLQDAHSSGAGDKIPTAPSATVERLDPYSVLGLSPSATANEIKKAYHQQMSAYHPDKVEHLGDDIKAVATRRTLEIQLAMEQIRELCI